MDQPIHKVFLNLKNTMQKYLIDVIERIKPVTIFMSMEQSVNKIMSNGENIIRRLRLKIRFMKIRHLQIELFN